MSTAKQPPEKLSGGLSDASDDAPTYQQSLDEALAQTFPASDPISPGSAMNAEPEPTSTTRDEVDWRLHPGSRVWPDGSVPDIPWATLACGAALGALLGATLGRRHGALGAALGAGLAYAWSCGIGGAQDSAAGGASNSDEGESDTRTEGTSPAAAKRTPGARARRAAQRGPQGAPGPARG